MKKIAIILLVFIVANPLANCQHRVRSSHSTRESNSTNESKTVIIDDNVFLEIRYSGEVKINDDETGILSIPSNGYIKYKKNGKKLTIERGSDGEILYAINGGSKKSILDTAEKQFVATVIKEMIAHGLGAKDRAERIYKKGGASALLNEVELLKSDYVKSIYFETLLYGNLLSQEEVITSLNKINSLIHSDFEKAKLLKQFSANKLADASCSQAYFNAVKGIGSDFEKANVIKELNKNELTNQQFMDALETAKSIGSDFEKANVLKEILEQPGLSGERFDRALAVSNTIESDFEKANVIKHLMSKGIFSGESFSKLLNSIAQIDSDFERANIFKELAGNSFKTEEQWIGLLSETEKISSDFEKANVLKSIAKKMPATEKVKSAFMAAAKTIDSDMEYGSVMRAIR